MTTDSILELAVTIIVSIMASSGFWIFLDKRRDKKSLQTDLLIGLAHDRIVYLGISYMERGWISQEEYENLVEYLYKPYQALGGNGSAKRIMLEIDRLPIQTKLYSQKKENKGE